MYEKLLLTVLIVVSVTTMFYRLLHEQISFRVSGKLFLWARMHLILRRLMFMEMNLDFLP